MKSKKFFFFSLILLGSGLTTFGLSLIISGLGLKTCYIPTDKNLPVHSSNLINLTNMERIKEGFSPLKESKALSCLAFERAKVILENDDFSHSFETGNPTMRDLAQKMGLTFRYFLLGENLAKDFNDEEEIVNSWMVSPKHKENILSKKFKEIGVAVVKGEFEGKETIVVVQIFGEKLGLFEWLFGG